MAARPAGCVKVWARYECDLPTALPFTCISTQLVKKTTMLTVKKIKTYAFSIVALFFCGKVYADEFIWRNLLVNAIKYSTGSNLTGSVDPAMGCFVQLVDAGADRTNNIAVYSGIGVTGDDQVVQTAWIGKDTSFIGNPDGADGIVYVVFSNAIPEHSYFVRAWSQPSPAYTGGLVPSQNSLFNDSPLWVHHSGETPFGIITFEFAGAFGWATTKTALPAPGTSVGLTVIKSGTSAQLSWTAADGAISYRIYRTSSANTAPSATDKIGETVLLSYADTLSGSGLFYYWVEPVNSAGSGGFSTSTVFRKTIAMPWLNLLLE